MLHKETIESVVMMSGNFNWQKTSYHLHLMTSNSDKLVPHNL